jgi:2-phosphoglycerate kinase
MLKEKLSHVLWLGGGTDAGKTTVARLLAEKHGWRLYEFDRSEPAHIERLLAEGAKYYGEFMAMTEDERWILRSPAEMAAGTIGGWSERVKLVVEELLVMPQDGIILAEGPGFFPEVIQPFLSSPFQAVWLVPTEEFKWFSMKQRGKYVRRRQMSDSERAVNNHFGRDMIMAAHVVEQAKKLGLEVITVDGSMPAKGVAGLVEGHFGRYLRESQGAS